MKLKYMIGVLLVLQWIGGVFTQGIAKPLSCCIKTSKDKVRVEHVLRYVHQNGPPCSVNAVRFTLYNNNTICSDPEDPWAKRAIKMVDGRKPLTEITTRASTKSTINMMAPTGTSTTPKPTTHISPTSSIQQPLGNTNKPPQRTTTNQITSSKESTAMEMKPDRPEPKKTSTTMKSENRVTPTIPKQTSVGRKLTTYITHTASTQDLTGENSKSPQWTTTPEITTKTESTTTKRNADTPEPKTIMTENKVTLTIPKGTSTDRTPTAYITHTASAKQSLGNTNKSPQRTTMQITMRKESTTMEIKPVTPEPKKTSTTMKRENIVTQPMPKVTSMALKPTTHITHTASTQDLPGQNSKSPQWTTTPEITTKTESTTTKGTADTPEPKTMTPENRVTLTRPKGISTARKPTAYITHTALTQELPSDTNKPSQWTTLEITTRTKSIAEGKPSTPEPKTNAMSETRVTQTLKPSTMESVKPVNKPCPTRGYNSANSSSIKIPWTVRRLRKKSKKGLRRAQMNYRPDPECT